MGRESFLNNVLSGVLKVDFRNSPIRSKTKVRIELIDASAFRKALHISRPRRCVADNQRFVTHTIDPSADIPRTAANSDLEALTSVLRTIQHLKCTLSKTTILLPAGTTQ
jgi:hypothetical protein